MRARRAFQIQLPFCSRRSVRVRLAVGQLPRAVLASVLSTSSGIVLLNPASQVVGMPDVESTCFDAPQDINIIHQFDIPMPAEARHRRIKWLIPELATFPKGRSSQAELLPERINYRVYYIGLLVASYNKFTGSISIATFTAGRIGRSARRAAKSLCMVAGLGAWMMICIL